MHQYPFLSGIPTMKPALFADTLPSSRFDRDAGLCAHQRGRGRPENRTIPD
jgi:hypothetical protein